MYLASFLFMGNIIFWKNLAKKNYKRKQKNYKKVSLIFKDLIDKIPALNDFFIDNQPIDRNNLSCNILFRPIGQNILFDLVKVGIHFDKLDSVINYFKESNFTFNNHIWYSIFWDSETNTIVTDKMRQKFATILILEKLNFQVKRTSNDKKVLNNFGISLNDI